MCSFPLLLVDVLSQVTCSSCLKFLQVDSIAASTHSISKSCVILLLHRLIKSYSLLWPTIFDMQHQLHDVQGRNQLVWRSWSRASLALRPAWLKQSSATCECSSSLRIQWIFQRALFGRLWGLSTWRNLVYTPHRVHGQAKQVPCASPARSRALHKLIIRVWWSNQVCILCLLNSLPWQVCCCQQYSLCPLWFASSLMAVQAWNQLV